MCMLDFLFAWLVVTSATRYNDILGSVVLEHNAKAYTIDELQSELAVLVNPLPESWTDDQWRAGCELMRDALGMLPLSDEFANHNRWTNYRRWWGYIGFEPSSMHAAITEKFENSL